MKSQARYLFLLSCLMVSVSHAREASFLTLPKQEITLPSDGIESFKRKALVSFNPEVLNGVISKRSRHAPVSLKLFDDNTIKVIFTEKQKYGENSFSYMGRTLDSDLLNVTAVVSGEEFIISIRGNVSQYRVVGKNGSGVVTEEALPTTATSCGVGRYTRSFSPKLSEAISAASSLLQYEKRSYKQERTANDSVIDLLLVYNTNAQKWVKDQGTSTQTYSLEIQNHLNSILKNNRLNFQFRILSHIDVNDTAGRFFEKLLELDGQKARFVDQNTYIPEPLPESERQLYNLVNKERERVGADLVAYFARPTEPGDGDDTGIANTLTKQVPNVTCDNTSCVNDANSTVFTVTKINDALGNTLMHELGHNLGGGHALQQLKDVGEGPNIDFAPYAAGNYVYQDHKVEVYDQPGYYYSYKGYHTIMAYNFYYQDNEPLLFNSEKLLFSSPDLGIDGKPTGNASSADNRRVLATSAPFVAEYRECKVNCGNTSTPVEFLFSNGFE